MNSTVWIAVAVFVVVAIGVGAVSVLGWVGDKKRADDVANDESRMHTDPHDPHQQP